MCMIDWADGRCDVLVCRHQRARLTHKCTECGRVIEIGEKYLYERTKFEGDVQTHRTCPHCERVRQWLTAECGGWLWQGVEEDICEHADDWHLYGIGVKMLAIGIRRQWRRRDGTLWRIPSVPKTTHEKMAQKS